MTKEKIQELDLLRGIAFLAVVLQHTIGVFIRKTDILLPDAIMMGILFNVVKFAVPTFVFITGMVLIYNYYDQLNYPKFIWRRVLDIFLPYTLWSMIYFYYYNGLNSLGLASVKPFAKQLILGTASYHLWYVIMVFQFYLLIPVFLFLFRKFSPIIKDLKKSTVLIVLLATLYTVLMWFSNYYIPSGLFNPKQYLIQALFIKYRSTNFLFYSFYFILGGTIVFHLAKWRRLVEKSVIWNGLLFIILFFWVGVQLFQGIQKTGVVNLNLSTSLKPSMFLFTVASIILLYKIALVTLKNNPLSTRILIFLGKYSFGAYLAHALVLTYSVRSLMPFIHYQNYPVMLFLVFLLTSTVSTVITYILSRLPIGNLLIGKTKK